MINCSWIFVWLFVVLVPFSKRAWFKNLVALLYKTFSRKEKKLTFLSLPDEIILNCLARISRSHYPKLSLVSKTFRSLLMSHKLNVERFHLKTTETFFHVCLKLPDRPSPSMFTLWIKPGQILMNQLEKKERSTGDTRLVQIPSSYYNKVPLYVITVGSELYGLSQRNDPSSNMLVRNKEFLFCRNSPNMIVARAKARAVVFYGKIYVMGGCAANESANWGEVFDPKTQIWEALPDPGPELRFSSIRGIEVIEGKLYIRSNEEKDSVYDPKEGKWDVAKKSHLQCMIGCEMIEIANYGGKLLILWDKIGPSQEKDIWCAVIALEKRDGIDEVWGKIEWASIVLTVPCSYVFLYSLLNRW
ncbi:hypothetical protein ARALYDRAFT_327005 [Arabidopsis lyrata subsp. lyrata]|uniref:F-box domain-containing protein n=1 Tax=Arabidopsis lyrata subsp. lyrata TaxID=81972 RepID=D7M6T8_ARALL|nr:hypothetical protein ARALYDRAFT_327005 [Arabidopsis lyrata subsp. lyrata]